MARLLDRQEGREQQEPQPCTRISQHQRDGDVTPRSSPDALKPQPQGRGASTLCWSAFQYCDKIAQISSTGEMGQKDSPELKVSMGQGESGFQNQRTWAGARAVLVLAVQGPVSEPRTSERQHEAAPVHVHIHIHALSRLVRHAVTL